MAARPTVLIVDDDPAHLRIYGWIIEAAGYCALPLEPRQIGTQLPSQPFDAVLLDYNLGHGLDAPCIAALIRTAFPNVPVLLLSDCWEMPLDVAPLVQGFVRKGEPDKLVRTLHGLLPPLPPRPSPKPAVEEISSVKTA